MRLIIIHVALSTLLVALVGCGPEESSPADAGTTVTYTKDVQPILAAKCSPCHAGQRQGFHDIVTNYNDALKHVESIDSVDCWKDWGAEDLTMPKTVGECSLISARNGRMPAAMNCGAMPMKAVCVQQAEQDILAAWVAAGMPK